MNDGYHSSFGYHWIFYSFNSSSKNISKMAATEFNEQQLEDIKECIELFDKDGDNNIYFYQVGDVVRALGECPTNEDVEKFMGNPSKEDMKAKKLCLEEFLPIYGQIMQGSVKGTMEDFVEGLRVFDKDGNGTVMGAEIRHVLTTLGEKLSSAEVSQVMKGQEDSSGSLNYEGFSKFLMEVPASAI
uniref:myosin light chain 3, skeletal muscle isoform-like isoform X1 n=1 Tax=Styela clava TaxID=7725 RepID=UPI001939F532|nr:myosin light chain 3, skeletal muscle isoform-like isoform X1 [Styela clava]